MIKKISGYVQKHITPIKSVIASAAAVFFLRLNTSNIFAPVFLILFFFLFRAEKNLYPSKRIITASRICGGIFSAALLLSELEYLADSARFAVLKIVIVAAGLYFCLTSIIRILFTALEKYELTPDDAVSSPEIKRSAAIFLGSMIIMLLCWLPMFLLDFPGVITSDSLEQLEQATGYRQLSNHHPVAHTAVIGALFRLGLTIFGSEAAAVAFYCCVQAVLLAAAFAFMIQTLYRFRVKKWYLIIAQLYFSLIHFHASFSHTMWKDVWFAGFVTVFITALARIIACMERNSKSPVLELILILLSGIGIALFRTNGFYAFIITVLFLVFFFVKKKKFAAIAAALSALIIATVIKYPVYGSMNIKEPDLAENLSIPLQTLSRAITDGAKLTDEQYALLSQVVDVEKIPETYSNSISDPIKNLIREKKAQEYISEHKWDYIKLWADVGIRNPMSYLYGYIDQTKGYWTPDVQYWIISQSCLNTISDDHSFDYYPSPIITGYLADILNDSLYLYMRVPFLGLFFSIGAMVWLSISMFALCAVKRRNCWLLLFVPVFAVLATLMAATPVYAEFRYIYCVFTVIPLYVALPFIKTGDIKKTTACL